MAKKTKKEKQAANIFVFLVEGDSDQIALELPLATMITDKYPEYEVRFLQQQKLVDKTGEEVEDSDKDEEDGFIEEDEYERGGDITASPYVKPENIETKINSRFIKPVTKAEGVYPKKIVRIVQIVDLDGAFIPDKSVISLSDENIGLDNPFYDGEKGTIETKNIPGIIERNKRKRKNLEYLISLSDTGIKIGTRTIPYEIYFFTSNLDHFINHDANMKDSKRYKADQFVRKYGLDTEDFCKYFFDDPASIGCLGYRESWEEIRKGTNSVKRFTNIDCLIRQFIDTE